MNVGNVGVDFNTPGWCSEKDWDDALKVASELPIGVLGVKTLATEIAKLLKTKRDNITNA